MSNNDIFLPASPLLVIAYALAGTVDINFEIQPIGKSEDGREVFLRDIWPSRDEIQSIERKYVIPAMFKDVYEKIELGSQNWQSLEAPKGKLYPWDQASTYIKHPPFFEGMTRNLPEPRPIKNARVLLNLGDSITTDHISPAGSIARNSPAGWFSSSSFFCQLQSLTSLQLATLPIEVCSQRTLTATVRDEATMP